jgi:hypothetical protein
MKRLLFVCAAFAIGCSNNNGNPGGGQDGGGGGNMDLAGVPLVAVTGMVRSETGGGGPAVSGATVEVMGASPANKTTTAADGSYSLMVAAGSTAFLRASASGYKSDMKAIIVPSTGGTLDIKILVQAKFDQVKTALNLNPDPAKGFVNLNFNVPSTDLAGGYGATLSAAHDSSFAFDMNGKPTFSNMTLPQSAGSGMQNNALIYPNVVAGTTTITLNPPSGKTCTLRQAIANWRVDPDTFMEVEADCQ